ncbi:hypothetical protein, partial [Megasphaera elsdenii]|uniref:hypothetical protein n=1 Tax=Megasphaera elsdenii TaxID=907 RepID=UPI0026702BE1
FSRGKTPIYVNYVIAHNTRRAARYGIMETLLTEQSSHVKIAKVRRLPTPGFFKLQKNFLDLEGTVVIHYKGSLT